MHKYVCVNHSERKARSKKTLLCSYCYKKQLMEKNPEFAERQKEASKEFKKKNPLYFSAKYFEYAEKDPDGYIRRQKQSTYLNFKRKLKGYGLTEEEYRARLDKGCEVCGSLDRLHIDHCHAGGFFRGILCGKCNTGVGMFNDDVLRLQKMIEYLKVHGK